MLKEGEIRIPSGCAIAGVISKEGKNINGKIIVDSMTVMHERSNGLGGGFAGYGIYPEYKDYYAFHLFYDGKEAKEVCEKYLDKKFEIINLSKIPVRKTPKITDEPLIWRYFVMPNHNLLRDSQLDEKEYVSRCIIYINTEIKGAYVFSSGKNMGCFKGVGFPEDIGDYFMLENYNGYLWTAHGRYPTNTPGWWGGAHPFSFLDTSVVHNGEISSYDANRRYIEMFGYKCNLLTDTEVIAYIIDFLSRKKGLTMEEISLVISAPFWQTIDKADTEKKELCEYLRKEFPSLLITGPFSILVGFDGGVMALNDRLKLRSMVVGEKDDKVYFASEECAIRKMEENVENIWSPKGGEPVVVTVNKEKL
ncbi:MAG: glutamine amidotransferase family protein [Clostridia bacterium]|nr:glutamine amidotransferase family protein [Clostridia bacterium]